MRPLRILLSLAVLLIALACLILPALGALGLPAMVHLKPPLFRIVAEYSGPQFLGPTIELMAGGIMLTVSLRRQNLPLWVPLTALAGACYSGFVVRAVSHEFGHVVLNECGSTYGEIIRMLSTIAGLAAVAFLSTEWSSRRCSRMASERQTAQEQEPEKPVLSDEIEPGLR